MYILFTKEKYIGDWMKGEKSGKGFLHYANGTILEGEWKND